MSITSSVIWWTFCIAAVATAATAFAAVDAPASVRLSNGRELQQYEKRLVEVDAGRHRTSAVRLPVALRRAVASASSIGFPSASSRTIDGKEFVLIVVNQSSSRNPMGYCGAGEESTLYVLQINGDAAASSYAMPVQSCLDSVSLDTDGDNRSPYLAIEWIDDPMGFKVSWTNIDDAGPATREYRYDGRAFVERKR
ncbi:hypothetical protein CFB46_04185 [Burkholderia sp. HI2761]|uniref:hypothetical protein n=1 Tax=unclassified Burkholderia TaxID=2613784 RepID=UPI000B7AA1E3|nr:MULTISPECIES: hypothetical protein [unclassified Burkholderia]MPV60922.1 hypothetical protein [Burkholderia sp. BE24]OXJ28777.1 hypothetical protein CFB46_04185 [Burkholderia sp. HI2761]